MAGCYGNSAEDRYYEAMLDRYLDQQQDVLEPFYDQAEEIINEEINSLDPEFTGFLFDEYYIDIDDIDDFEPTEEQKQSYIDKRLEKVAEELYEEEASRYEY